MAAKNLQTSPNWTGLARYCRLRSLFENSNPIGRRSFSAPLEIPVPAILILNGPNLNLLGSREPELYGRETLGDIETGLRAIADAAGVGLEFFQSNAEHALIERVHAARDPRVDAIIINPGAFTHTSIALRDAFSAVAIPFVEVHLSNVHAREEFRQHSYLSDLAIGVVTGFGADSYRMALEAMLRRFSAAQ